MQGGGKSGFKVVHIENNIIINNNTRMNSVSHTAVSLLLPHPVFSLQFVLLSHWVIGPLKFYSICHCPYLPIIIGVHAHEL